MIRGSQWTLSYGKFLDIFFSTWYLPTTPTVYLRACYNLRATTWLPILLLAPYLCEPKVCTTSCKNRLDTIVIELPSMHVKQSGKRIIKLLYVVSKLFDERLFISIHVGFSWDKSSTKKFNAYSTIHGVKSMDFRTQSFGSRRDSYVLVQLVVQVHVVLYNVSLVVI